ncbi:MAG TPA: response regulator transcription factor [Pirellulales bacterium]|jgi:DNA-binding response OmpR family regulator|nr:response regulator transcription factor [Pirellulales bacterium]
MQHILVVEDDPHIANGIQFNLEAEGYFVTVLGDGPAAVEFSKQHPRETDLIILDLMLPGMSGYAVCEKIREIDIDLPILMLSARTLTEDRVRGFNVGADVYLQKPFDLEELLSIVRNLLARRARPRPEEPRIAPRNGAARNGDDVYRFGQAEVNFDTYQVTVAGKNVRLTTLEMKLLRYFVEREGSVVTRGELLENVWELPHTITTRTVDNFIVNLRKYFETDPAHPRHFLSVRGAGYRFVAAGAEE